MSDLVRLSFTIEQALHDRLSALMGDSGYANRSEFIRDLIRGRLVEEEWKADEEAVGTITLVYDHEMRHLSHKLTAVQHHHHDAVLATTHVHLDEHICAEMIMVRGRAKVIEHIADEMRSQKGVLHATVSMSSTGKQLG
ncbi:MAG: nickel-responsive transcriptional regulator NikR [bacterium]|nr:nickel-responsive transcriptional regulator NikR [bacterium]